MNYGGQAVEGPKVAVGLMPRTQTMAETLSVEKAQLSARLAEIAEAEAILARHPDIERLLTILGRWR